MGVHSVSNGRPVKTGGFDEADKEFDGRNRYSEWQFVYTPPNPIGVQQPRASALQAK